MKLLIKQLKLIEAPSKNLSKRVYNIASFSSTPNELYNFIKDEFPNFKVNFISDYRQKLADSWPSSIDSSNFKKDINSEFEFGFESSIESILKDMKEKLKLNKF